MGTVYQLVNSTKSEVKLLGFDQGFTCYLGKLRSYLNFFSISMFLLSHNEINCAPSIHLLCRLHELIYVNMLKQCLAHEHSLRVTCFIIVFN